MLEVCQRFPKIGTIEDYQALPPGERALYNQHTLKKLEAEAKTTAIKFTK
jgi:hypothetical protein